MSIAEKIQSNLRRIIDESGISQAELARRSQCTEMAISRYLRGVYSPRVDELARIAESLGITVDSLFR